MEGRRLYRRRGTSDLQMATYIGIAGENMVGNTPANYHPETEIGLQLAGTTTEQIGDQTIRHQPGDIWIIPSETIHRRIDFSSDAVVHRMVFSHEAIRMHPDHFFQKEFVQPLSEGRLILPALLQPEHPAYDTIYALLMRLEHCRIYEKNYKQQRLFVLMGICIALMPYCHICENIPVIPNTGHEGVKLCMRYIHNHHTEKVTLDEIARYCHLHPNYLCAVFKQYTGESIFDYLTKVRIEAAARLLSHENLPVSKVAELAGFHSECFFYKKFKEHMGITPKAYAKSKKL